MIVFILSFLFLSLVLFWQYTHIPKKNIIEIIRTLENNHLEKKVTNLIEGQFLDNTHYCYITKGLKFNIYFCDPYLLYKGKFYNINIPQFSLKKNKMIKLLNERIVAADVLKILTRNDSKNSQ